MTVLNKDGIFGSMQRTAAAKVSTATGIAATDLDTTPTNTVQLMLSGTSGAAPVGGAVITRLGANLVEPSITTATQLVLYLSKDGGTTMFRIKAVTHAAGTIAVTAGLPTDDFGYTESAPLRLEEGDRLYLQARAGSAVTDAFHFVAEYTQLDAASANV